MVIEPSWEALGLKQVAHSAQMPFLAYLITVALEESNNEKTGG